MIHPVHVPPDTLTAEDRRDLPSDGKRYEILEGELAVSPAPSTRHQRILFELLLRLGLRLRAEGVLLCAPVDVILDSHTVCQPDLVYVSAGRAAIVEADAIRGAPDLVVEILSPSTRRTDVVVKSRLYARAGVGAHWIVDPDLDRIEAFTLAGASWGAPAVAASPDVFAPAGFPGLELPLRDVFGR